jgi:hypothetical protein
MDGSLNRDNVGFDSVQFELLKMRKLLNGLPWHHTGLDGRKK